MWTRANSRWVLFTVQERWQRDAGAGVPSVAGACVVAACGDGGGEYPSSAAPRRAPSTGLSGRWRRGETGLDLLQKQSQQFSSAFGCTPVGLLDPVSTSLPYPLRPEPKLNEKHAKNSSRGKRQESLQEPQCSRVEGPAARQSRQTGAAVRAALCADRGRALATSFCGWRVGDANRRLGTALHSGAVPPRLADRSGWTHRAARSPDWVPHDLPQGPILASPSGVSGCD